MSHETDNGGRIPSDIWWRIVGLAVLIMVVQWWAQHHLGLSVWEGLTGGLAVSMVVGLTKFVWEGVLDADADPWKKPLRRFARFLIRTSSLLSIGIVILLVGSFLTTVTIVTSGEEGEASLFSSVPDRNAGPIRSEALSADEPLRFLLPANPFGRLFTLRVRGYQDYTFEAASWKGKRVFLQRDLLRTPSLLIRIPPRELSVVEGATLRISELPAGESAEESDLTKTVLSAQDGAVWFGPPQPLNEGLLSQWQWYLKAVSGEAGNGTAHPGFEVDKAVAKTLLRWTSPRQGPTEPLEIRQGMTLKASLVSSERVELASREFIVNSETFQDILLNPRPL